MEIQWKICRATISFDSFRVVINLQFEMPKPKLESPSKDIASRKLTQLRPKLSRVGKEVVL